jgi:hypothetical protein
MINIYALLHPNTLDRIEQAMRMAARRSLRNKWHQGCAQVRNKHGKPYLQVVYYRGHWQPWEFIECETHVYITTAVRHVLQSVDQLQLMRAAA